MLKIEKALNSLYRKIEGVSGRFGAYRTAEEQSAIDAGKADVGDSYTKAESDAAVAAVQATAQEAQTAAEQARVDVGAESAARIAADAEINDRLNLLWELNEDISYDFVERVENGANSAPKGAVRESLMDLRGKTEQESTDGYQMLQPKKYKQTSNGVTFETDNASIYRIFGTAEQANCYGNYVEMNALYLEPGTYTLSISSGLPDHAFFQIIASKNGSTGWSSSLIGLNVSTNYETKTVTINEGYYAKWRPSIQGANIGDTFDFTMKCMLEKGSTAHPYEPYTGGIPSPNPDYPKPIHSVERLNIKRTDADGTVIEEQEIVPPRPLNSVGDYKDVCDVESGEWVYKTYHEKLVKNIVRSTSKGSMYADGRYTIGLNTTLNGHKSFGDAYNRNGISTIAIPVVAYRPAEGNTFYLDGGNNGAINLYIDANDVDDGYEKATNSEILYALETEETEPITEDDLTFLRSLENLPSTDHIIITDQDGNDVSYLVKYLRSVRDAL